MRCVLLAIAFILLAAGSTRSETLRVSGGPDPRLGYFAALIEQGFAAGGRTVAIEEVPAMPQPRTLSALDDGRLSAVPAQRTAERDRRWPVVPVGLTNGLLGRRILFIRPGDEPRFAAIRSVDDLRASGAVGGFGSGWYDVEVWRANDLPAVEVPGSWLVLFSMLSAGNRGIDYLSRGAFEIAAEAPVYPGLAVEPTLVLDYGGDFVFYLTPSLEPLVPTLTEGLARMRQDGRIQQLIERYFGAQLQALNLADRVQIRLAQPAQ